MANGEFGLYLIAESVRQERERKRLLAPTPTYTLDELKQLAREWANDRQISEYSRWQISELFAWLAKQEQLKQTSRRECNCAFGYEPGHQCLNQR